MKTETILYDKQKAIYTISSDCNVNYKHPLPVRLTVETKDCWDGNITDEKVDIQDVLRNPMNPCTGPIYFEGVKQGDVLEIKINDITCKSPGSVATIDFEGVCKDIVEEVTVKLFEFDEEKLSMKLGNCVVPINPMIGVIGVIPKVGEYPACLSGDWGGNMDTTLIKKGATLYLPVQLEGGLLYMGDAHAQMGEGEQYTTGLECDAVIDITVDVKRDLKIDIPFVKVDGRLASIYTDSNKDTDAALRGAMKKFIRFMVDNAAANKAIKYNDAGIACGLFGDLEISQIADDPCRTARLSMDLNILRDYIGVEL